MGLSLSIFQVYKDSSVTVVAQGGASDHAAVDQIERCSGDYVNNGFRGCSNMRRGGYNLSEVKI